MPDEYGIQHDIELAEKRRLKAMEQKEVFRPAPLKKVLKYEYPFLGAGETNTKNFLLAEDPYSVAKTDALRAHWIGEAKLLFG